MISRQPRIVHFTTVHPRHDTRIGVKEVTSLAETLDEPVALYVMDGQGDETDNEGRVQIIDVGPAPRGRLLRMTLGAWRMGRAVLRARPRVAHFHDPELIPVGFALRLAGVRVIYDVHEDVPRQILSKHWLPAVVRRPVARRPVAWAVSALEWFAGRSMTAIVAATPTIAARFPAPKTVTVQNFPILSELTVPDSLPYDQRPSHVAYVGGITRNRGAIEMVEAIARVSCGDARLRMAGNVEPASLRDELATQSGWERVDKLGWADRQQVANLLGSVRAGLVVLHPIANYPDAYPVKMFEYMAAGLPVIASNFPLWREIVEGNECGLTVDPLDPEAIAEAIQYLLDHPDEAQTMGENGRKAVAERFNWGNEAEKLLALYGKKSRS